MVFIPVVSCQIYMSTLKNKKSKTYTQSIMLDNTTALSTLADITII